MTTAISRQGGTVDRRLQRQALIPGWDQQRLRESTIQIIAPDQTHPLLFDAFMRGSIMMGIGSLHVVGNVWKESVETLCRFARDICSDTVIEICEGNATRNPNTQDYPKDIIIHFPTENNRIGEKKRKGENRPIILGNADNHSVSWFAGDSDNMSAWTIPSIHTSPALYLCLAGLLLAEAVQQLMPLNVWAGSTMTQPVQIDLNTYATQKVDSENDVQTDGTLALLGGGALGNWFLWGFPWTNLISRYSEIVIVDNDRVDRTNLNRQVFFTADDIGQYKAAVLSERLSEALLATDVTGIPERLESVSFLNDRDINPGALVSALDNWHSRWLLNQIALEYRIPIVNGGTDYYSANVYAHWPGVTPCLDCALNLDRKRQANNNQQSCAMAEPSVVTTNMIAAGFMLHQLEHRAAHGIIQYDLSAPDRIGRLEVFGSKEDCPCHDSMPKENNENVMKDATCAIRDSFYLW